MDPVPAPVTTWYEFTAGEGYTDRLAGALTRFLLTRPLGLGVVAAGGVTAIGAGILLDLPPLAFLAVVPLGAVLGATALFLSFRISVSRSTRPGSRFRVGFAADGLHVSGPDGEARMHYTSLGRAYRRGRNVIVRIESARTYAAFPDELIPPDAGDWLVAHLEALRSRR